VTEIVEAEMGQPGRLRKAPPGAAQRRRVHRTAKGAGKHQHVLLVWQPTCQPTLNLPYPVLPESCYRRPGEGHRARAAVALGLAKDESLAREPLARLANLEQPGLQVDVLPAEAEELSQPESGHNGCVHKRTVRSFLGGRDDVPDLLGREGRYLEASGPGCLNGVRRVSGKDLPLQSVLKGLPKYPVTLEHGSGGEPCAQDSLVSVLDMQWAKLREREVFPGSV